VDFENNKIRYVECKRYSKSLFKYESPEIEDFTEEDKVLRVEIKPSVKLDWLVEDNVFSVIREVEKEIREEEELVVITILVKVYKKDIV